MATAISLLASSVHLVLLLVTSFVGLANVTEASGCPVVTHSSACPRPSESELAWNAPAELLAMEAELKQSPDLELQLGRDYFTMILDHSQVTLRITAEGNVDWKDGIPTIYSILRERVLQVGVEQMYIVEAAASGHWLCMNEKGRLYTLRPQRSRCPASVRRRHRRRHCHPARRKHGRGHIHLMKRQRGGHQRRRKGAGMPPPADCLFKTFEFNPNDSYERSVGIYSFTHSNATHGRFLSQNRHTGKARSYRKSFRRLAPHAHVRITQVPVCHLREVVQETRFGKMELYNRSVRQCIIHRLVAGDCPSSWLGRYSTTWLSRLVRRCHRRGWKMGATATTPPLSV